MRGFVIVKGTAGEKAINPSLVAHAEIDAKGNAVLHFMGGGQVGLTPAEWASVKVEFVGAEAPPAGTEPKPAGI